MTTHIHRVDAHQHFWSYDKTEYPWIDSSMDILKQDFLPQTLNPILQKHSVQGSIAVQARVSEQETEFLLKLSTQSSHILGIVGWVDLCSNSLASSLEKWSDHSIIKGYRHLVQDEPNPSEFLQRSDFNQGIALLIKHDKLYEILIHEKDLPASIQFSQHHDQGNLVLCHLGKPNIQHSTLQQWRKNLLPFKQLTHVSCKLSGLITEAVWYQWTPEQLIPYIHTALEIFGTNRLMFGSDWPVCLCSGTVDQVYHLIEKATSSLSTTEQNAIWGENATRIYQLSRSI